MICTRKACISILIEKSKRYVIMDRKKAKKIVTEVMPQYNGKLTALQAEEGRSLALENSKRLLNSAKLLLHSGDPATSLSLAILAIEEHGKLEILDQIESAKTQEELSDAWWRYRNHISKSGDFNKITAALKAVPEGAATREYCEKNEDLLPLLDLLKQMGFYTDCGRNCRWHSPQNIKSLLAVATVTAAERAITGRIDPLMLQKAIQEAERISK